MTIPDYFQADTYDAAPIQWQDSGLRSHQRIAARFAQYAESTALYVHGTGWHYWDGARWAADLHKVQAHKTLTELIKVCWAAEGMTDKDLAADLRAANTGAGSNSVLDLASRRLFAAEVDVDPYLLNCQNGTLDLHKLELRPHDPADQITKICNASYTPGIDSARWVDFLNSSLPDVAVQEFLQRFTGSALIGKVIDHVLVIATGTGRNGKSVLANAVANMLGDYAVTASNDMLVSGKYKGHKSAGELSAQMVLRGSRFAVMSELEKGSELAESTMKTLTGGDTISAKFMGQDRIEFKPSHSFFMLTNELPNVDPTAKAVWARMRVVPFDVSFEGKEDTRLEDDLQLAADSILDWAVAGLWAYHREGLNAPAQVLARTDAYRAENDTVQQFMADECVMNPNARVSRSDLHHAYLEWARDNGAEQLTPRALVPRVAALPGIGEAKIRGTLHWKGAGLKNDEPNTD
ncbi:DNA primase family protein [Paeniglutamicibacter antarcticus]|uniref:Phage/plasmid primase, P4 family n=1 Tax=Paeniglutamicibacter antarcticus TaxID=494023 RepID=A0ABP9TMA9_9MICC